MTPVSSIPWGISFALPCGESRRWWIHKVSLPPRWWAHCCMTSTSKRPVFLWSSAFGCKCRSCPVLRGTPQILQWSFPSQPGRDRQINTADSASWDPKSISSLCPSAACWLAAPAHRILFNSSRSTEVIYTIITALWWDISCACVPQVSWSLVPEWLSIDVTLY